MRDHIEFFRQFRTRFKTTGAIAPSSRFLAAAMTRPMSQRERPVRILEVGPGTGSVTRAIVRRLRPEDRLDLVELNETFVALLKQRFEQDAAYRPKASQSQIHCCPLEEFVAEQPYDYIISGLPLNNFPPDLVRSLFETMFSLLAPGGVLSYFEYMYVRSARQVVGKTSERERMRDLDGIIAPYLREHRFRRDWVFVNLPPAWVQHLRKPDGNGATS